MLEILSKKIIRYLNTLRLKKGKKYFFYILITFLSIVPFAGFSQLTKIMGIITDSLTKEPIPFVNVILKGTSIGATTNFNGEYSIETKHPSDTLIVSYIGYLTQKKHILKRQFQKIDFILSPKNITLSEVVIKPGRNPAEVILEKVIENKKKYNSDNLEKYKYEVYNKIQIDVNNITDKFRKRRVFNQFQFVFDNLDTSTVNGKAYLPLFLVETLSDFYHRKSPQTSREVILASKASGVENESFSQYLGNMYQKVNIYNNFITLFEKNFISPIANQSLNYYKYYLVDSTYIGDKWCYKLMFKPRRKQELTFTGSLWISDTSFAVKKVDVQIADDANINLINDLFAEQEYELVDGKHWMLVKESVVIDFNIVEEPKGTFGFFGHKTTSYKKFDFNIDKDNKIFSSPVHVQVDEVSLNKDKVFWVDARHDSLTQDEQTIYDIIDSVKNVPLFNTYYDIAQTIFTSYYIKGNFEIGPYMSLISFNELEGYRLRVGGRSSNKFSTKIMLLAHIAYGTKDEKFKYGGGFLYMLSKNPRRSFGIDYKYDIEQLGLSQSALGEDYLLASFLRRNPISKLSMVEQFKGFYEHEWITGLSSKIYLLHRVNYPVGIDTFNFNFDGANKNHITTSEIRLDGHFAYKEKFMMGEFERVSFGTKYPVFDVQLSFGFKDVLSSDYNYQKVQLRVKHWFNIGSFGWSKYIIEAGKIWGQLPYPLLKLHEGNETYYFDEYSFNTMNYYEFVSDRYLSVYFSHHFDGLFLNHIPLMRKLKWREVIYGKGVIGALSEKNKKYNSSAFELNELNQPFYEAGVGIENIFKFFRIDGVWRLSYLDHPNVNKFNLMITMQFYF